MPEQEPKPEGIAGVATEMIEALAVSRPGRKLLKEKIEIWRKDAQKYLEWSCEFDRIANTAENAMAAGAEKNEATDD